ncbi:MAG: UDP-N-acetylglucosamine 2-epimerase (non-hydrolyzing) [Bacteroidia bacterium]|nr:UDP-N-acetylglucosamine 2-epimerase (non-hydrolyzing) [Bacteroidia bacterium]
MKILTVVGARPQFIKAAAVSREIKKHVGLEEIIVHTGQHFDDNMSEIFFREMEIPEPKINLGINDMTNAAMTGKMIIELEKVMSDIKPDVVLIYGDTNSTLAGAIAGRKLHIKLAHVEAGLRSFNMKMQEEINRIVADRISDFLFCPTEDAFNNLRKEGFENFGCKLLNCGDVMFDAALYYSQASAEKSDIIGKLNLKDYIICTLHRAENTDNNERFTSIIEALNVISQKIPVVLPMHPRTKKIIASKNLKFYFKVIEPVGYFDMLELLKHSRLVMTDSGGLQKEAFFFKKFCVTLRDDTEWHQLAEDGYNGIAGSDTEKILLFADEMLNKKLSFSEKYFGNGDASKIIAETLLQ